MISKNDLDRVPDTVLERLITYFEKRKHEAERICAESALSYVQTTDEKQRSISLEAKGEVNAYASIINLLTR